MTVLEIVLTCALSLSWNLNVILGIGLKVANDLWKK